MKRSRIRLNCAIVAGWLWLNSRGRNALWIRRSEGKRGRIPHVGIMRRRGRSLTLVDYIPRVRKCGPLDEGQSFMLFDGTYQVQRWELVAVGTGDTIGEAFRAAQQKK